MRCASRVVVLSAVALLGCGGGDGRPCALDTDCPLGRMCASGRCLRLGESPRGRGDPDGEGGDCVRGPGGRCLPREGGAGSDADGGLGPLDGALPDGARPRSDGAMAFDGSIEADGSPIVLLDGALVDAPAPPPGTRRLGFVRARSTETVDVMDAEPVPRRRVARSFALEAQWYETMDVDPCTPNRVGACEAVVCFDQPERRVYAEAGMIEARGDLGVGALSPAADGTYAALGDAAAGLWSVDGAAVRFAATGGGLAGFESSFGTPHAVTVLEPLASGGGVGIALGSDLTISWMGSSPGVLVFRLELQVEGVPGYVECRFDASAGRGSVPFSMLGAAPPGVSVSGTVSIFTQTEQMLTLPGGWETRLEARTSAVFPSDTLGSTEVWHDLTLR